MKLHLEDFVNLNCQQLWVSISQETGTFPPHLATREPDHTTYRPAVTGRSHDEMSQVNSAVSLIQLPNPGPHNRVTLFLFCHRRVAEPENRDQNLGNRPPPGTREQESIYTTFVTRLTMRPVAPERGRFEKNCARRIRFSIPGYPVVLIFENCAEGDRITDSRSHVGMLGCADKQPSTGHDSRTH